ncbi:MFS transporter [Streptomyces cinnamoneus]|uniref:MFS transporter n=1 Tax=Streptomyces cinnamoneus TaxID=53446 RepID=A0A2G1XK96_STRCJ|nr:MFS transporter [Streptomyces cinnamoneus]PHQ51663.1 MFS transporter [Streptomyces cinnamoneus]PPT14426.1 MFS transporter [Streptomyces cinnamoneus]
MSSTSQPPAPASVPASGADPRRWWGLVVIALAQLMVVLDATVVNIALPSAQRALGMSDANRQWVVTAYTLAFGGLLLLGGRIADLVGRKRTFVIGLVGFAVASGLGGAARTDWQLFGARALQGVFAALLAPSALSLLTTTFTDPKERGKAFGVYSGIAGAGSAIGLLAGGLLTEYLNWRWCLYVNVPIALVAVLGALWMLHDHRPAHRPRLDIPSVLLACTGLVSIVYACSEAEPRGWGDPLVTGLLCAGAVLLTVFGWWQHKAPSPLLPPRITRDRNRAGAFLALALSVIAMFGMFLYMTYYFQGVLGYRPVTAGLAFLPLSATIILTTTQLSSRLLNHVPPRMMITPGAVCSAIGLFLLTSLPVEGAFATHVLPSEILFGIGMGLTFVAVMDTATRGVAPGDSGVTSATVNTSQQVGGSVGTALLNTIATSTAGAYVAAHLTAAAATGPLTPAVRDAITKSGVVHGFHVGLAWGSGVMLLAALVSWVLITAPAPEHRGPEDGEALTEGQVAPVYDAHRMRSV